MIQDEERIAHTGALARWAGRCARHPWRVVGSWGSDLRPPDRPERRVPRQADQRLQDPRLGHAEGDRPDHREVRRPEGRRAAGRPRGSAGQAARHAPQQRGRDPQDAGRRQRVASTTLAENPNGLVATSRARSSRTRISSSRNGRVAYFDVQYDRPASSCRGRASSRSRISFARSASRPVSRSSSPVRRRARRRRRGSATSSACSRPS